MVFLLLFSVPSIFVVVVGGVGLILNCLTLYIFIFIQCKLQGAKMQTEQKFMKITNRQQSV